jgi:hypothetical protein
VRGRRAARARKPGLPAGGTDFATPSAMMRNDPFPRDLGPGEVTGGHPRARDESDGPWLVIAAIATAILVALV